MNTLGEQQDLLRSLLAENENLVRQVWDHSRDIDELLAARKDALGGGTYRRSIGEPPSNEIKPAHGLRTAGPQEYAESTTTSSEAPSLPDDSSLPFLLLVEDDFDDFLLLRRALRRLDGMTRICWAQSTPEALSILGKIDASATRIYVLADVKLPGSDGFELLQSVKKTVDRTLVRFAFLTGCSNPNMEARAYAAGADACFFKPACLENWEEVAGALQGFVQGIPKHELKSESYARA